MFEALHFLLKPLVYSEFRLGQSLKYKNAQWAIAPILGKAELHF